MSFRTSAILFTASLSLGLVAFEGAALATANIPGVGVVVKKKPGDYSIMVGNSNGKGEIMLGRLTPGLYSVCAKENNACMDFQVGKNGTLRAHTVQGPKGPMIAP